VKKIDFPWTIAVAMLAIAATACAFASPSVTDALRADERIFDGQWWRLVTGPFLHATWAHLARDLALVAIAGTAYEGPLASRKLQLFAGGLVLPALTVLVSRDADWYCGLSGLSHALLAAALSFEFVRRRGVARAVVGLLCAIAATKPLFELVTGAPAFAMTLGANVAQVPLAHAIGVAVGIACGLAAGRDYKRATRPPNGKVRRSSVLSSSRYITPTSRPS
jgi:rhomboid family GlyGly-CTERM serine protease